ncbi:hypothetical protein EMCRGX_G033812 [Ephydatia muelleri]
MQVYCNDRHHATESYPDAEINQILSDMCFDQPEIVSENYASPVSLEDQQRRLLGTSSSDGRLRTSVSEVSSVPPLCMQPGS